MNVILTFVGKASHQSLNVLDSHPPLSHWICPETKCTYLPFLLLELSANFPLCMKWSGLWQISNWSYKIKRLLLYYFQNTQLANYPALSKVPHTHKKKKKANVIGSRLEVYTIFGYLFIHLKVSLVSCGFIHLGKT